MTKYISHDFLPWTAVKVDKTYVRCYDVFFIEIGSSTWLNLSLSAFKIFWQNYVTIIIRLNHCTIHLAVHRWVCLFLVPNWCHNLMWISAWYFPFLGLDLYSSTIKGVWQNFLKNVILSEPLCGALSCAQSRVCLSPVLNRRSTKHTHHIPMWINAWHFPCPSQNQPSCFHFPSIS